MTTPGSAEAPAPLRRIGIHLWGVAPGDGHDHHLAGCQRVWVGGSGAAFWDHFVRAYQSQPALRDHPDPVDAFVAQAVAEVPTKPTRRWRVIGERTRDVDARSLALAAGLGWRSPLDLVLHPDHGPWWAVRVVCFTQEAMPLSPSLGERPCDRCEAPCMPACPVGAVGRTGRALGTCLDHLATAPPCAAGCHARRACPHGADHAYPAAAERYHSQPSTRADVLRTLSPRAGGEPDRAS